MARLILSKKEFEIMEALWKLNRPVSFQEILEYNPGLNRNTLLTTMRKLQSAQLVKVEGVGYSNTSLTRLFTYKLSMSQYISQFMDDSQKADMALSLIDDIALPKELMKIRDSVSQKYEVNKTAADEEEEEEQETETGVIYPFNKNKD